ncbi:MAG: hypothetical protein LBK82_01960 [Planctomycetaceae bacterium]|nr:hypothetical protein [Planctomycetaceae bacterium]
MDSVFNVGVPETCWAETLTGTKNIFPQTADEAYEMRQFIVRPKTVFYQVKSGSGAPYNFVIDISYGEEGYPDVNESAYEEFKQKRVSQQIEKLLEQSKVVKTKMKQTMESAEKEYERALAYAVEKYNQAVEESQQDYELAMKLRQEAANLINQQARFLMFSRDTTIAKVNEDKVFNESVQKEIDNAKSSVMQYVGSRGAFDLLAPF